MVEGTGVKIPVPESSDFIRGFFSTRVVAATSPQQATSLAFEAVRNEWRFSGHEATDFSSAQPTLAVSELTQLRSRVYLRAPRGFTLYTQLG